MNRDELIAAILQALGEASMCWSNVEQAGTFQDEKTIEIAKRLADRIPLQRPPSAAVFADPRSTPEATP